MTTLRPTASWIAAIVAGTAIMLPATTGMSQNLAFAEGAGRFATGGRGGDVYFVTNLNDSASFAYIRHRSCGTGQ